MNEEISLEEDLDEITLSTSSLSPEEIAKIEAFLQSDKKNCFSEDVPEISSFGSTYPGAKRTEDKNEAFINRVLTGKTPEEAEQILRTAMELNIRGDDPLYVILVATGQLEYLLKKSPEELNSFFQQERNNWQEKLEYANTLFNEHSKKLITKISDTQKTLELQTSAALEVQSKNVSDTVSTLVRKAAFTKVAHDIYAMIAGSAVLLVAIAFGAVLGLAVPLFKKPPALDPKGIRTLTLEEAEALEWGLSVNGRFARSNPELIKWASSSEGKWAREFMQWNQALLSKKGKYVCEKDAEDLGVTLTLEGRHVKDGFCTLWVKSPQQRNYVK